MNLELILLIALGVWLLVLILVVALCRAARAGDRSNRPVRTTARAAGRPQGELVREPAELAALTGSSPHASISGSIAVEQSRVEAG
jgi:hypothetical protein